MFGDQPGLAVGEGGVVQFLPILDAVSLPLVVSSRSWGCLMPNRAAAALKET